MWSKFAEVQCAFAVAEVRKVTANLQIRGCGIECKFAVPSSDHYSSIYFYIKCNISLKSLFLEDFKYNKNKNFFLFKYANFMLISSPIGAELSSKLKYSYPKITTDYIFYQFFRNGS